jgi:SAM-dependent methyltransferase
MSGLANRPRVRHAVERLAGQALRVVGAPAPSAQPEQLQPPPTPPPAPAPPSPQAGDFARDWWQGWLAHEACDASTRLFDKLTREDVEEIVAGIRETPELAAQYEAAHSDLARRHMVLAFGIWLGFAAALERTALLAPHPPEDVHAMTRGPLAAAGGLYEADLVADALRSVGVELDSIASALDFGCSSGRVVRVLAAAYPQARWYGCDPNRPAIEWASANLPSVEFFLGSDAPPLTLDDGVLDAAYAISIWSHFEAGLGLRWFEEMHRVIRPGGYLVCTTHGLSSIAHYASSRQRSPEQSREIADALYRRGWWYAAEFGEEGDWGVVNPDWGTAFLSPEWLITQLCPHWRVLEFAPGRNQENQDVYVLQRA